MDQQDQQQQRRAISAREAATIAGVGLSTWWHIIRRDSNAPRPFRLSARATRWWQHEVIQWLDDRAAESRTAPPAPHIRKRTTSEVQS